MLGYGVWSAQALCPRSVLFAKSPRAATGPCVSGNLSGESEPSMKVGIVGAGAVGSACTLALVMRGCARNIVLVDRTRSRAKAVATDIRYGAPLSPLSNIDDGDYQDLAGASVVMITAGVNEKTGGAIDRKDPSGRLKLL